MKFEILYSTICEATVYSKENKDSWIFNQRFTTLQKALDWANEIIEISPFNFEIEKIYITDVKTGEMLAECFPDEEDAYEDEYADWGYNEDAGYDPYLGCYSDDC